MVDTIIFDFDNTLVDTEPLVSEAYCRVLRNCGVEPQLNPLGLIQDVGETGIMERLIARHRLEKGREELRLLFWTHYIEILSTSDIQMMPGARKAVEAGYDAGFKVGIATSSRNKAVDLIMKRLRLCPFWFDCIITRDDTLVAKPAPDLILLALKRLYSSSRLSAVFEDSQAGAEAGLAARCQVLVVPNRYTRHHYFPEGARILHSLEEVDEGFLLKL